MKAKTKMPVSPMMVGMPGGMMDMGPMPPVKKAKRKGVKSGSGQGNRTKGKTDKGGKKQRP